MKTIIGKRALSLLLSAALLITQMGVPVFAQAATPDASGLCEHHTEHTPECGYNEGADCTHEHTEDCYRTETVCTFIVLDEVDVSENTATPSDPPEQTEHECTEESGCITKTLDCKHTHDEACGFAEPSPCTYKCEICAAMDSGDVTIGVSSITVTGFDELEEAVRQRTVPVGTELAALNLPATLKATGYAVAEDTAVVDSGTAPVTTPAAITIEGVTWELDPANEVNNGNSTYDPAQGNYAFTPILPENYTLTESVALPEIWVMVGGMNLLAAQNYNINDASVTIDDSCGSSCQGHIITGTGEETGNNITVSGGSHDITIDNINISAGGCAFELQGTAKVNLTITGTNTLKSGDDKAGLQVQTMYDQTAEITIGGTGSLTASGDSAGIGGSRVYRSPYYVNGAGGIITINGGTVTANGIFGAGIGGSSGGAGGTITISGGIVTASTRASHGAGIGGGHLGAAGTFSTGKSGNAFIMASSIADRSKVGNWSGVIFEGKNGAVYGTPTISGDAITIPADHTLQVPAGTSATFSGSVTNNGAVSVYGGLQLTDSGSWTNQNSGAVLLFSGGTVGDGIDHTTASSGTYELGDFSVTGEQASLKFDTSTGILQILGGECTVAMKYGVNSTVHKIVVPKNVVAKITLNGVNIDTTKSGGSGCAFELQSNATVDLILADGSINTLTSTGGAGLQNASQAKLTIDVQTLGTGTLTATGGDGGAGIGGGAESPGGTIIINGGTIAATGGSEAAGIGGGNCYWNDGTTSNITINGGNITAIGNGPGAGIGGGLRYGAGNITINSGIISSTGGQDGPGIGPGSGGSGGAFSTGAPGNAVIIAKSISDQSDKSNWSGVVFEGNSGNVYKNPTPTEDFEIPSGATLTVPNGSTLTIPNGVTMTNSGTINNNGTISNTGTITNDGTFNNYGTITGTDPSGGGTINKPSQVVVSFTKSDDGALDTANTATYGDTIKVVATVGEKQTTRGRSVPARNTVDFYLGSVSDSNKLGNVSVSGTTATLSITLSESKWAAGSKTIIAVYGGGTNLVDSQGSAELTVEKIKIAKAITIGTVAPVNGAAIENGTNSPPSNANAPTISWSDDGGTTWTATGKFKPVTAYQAKYVYTANTNYIFDSTIVANDITVTNLGGGSKTVDVSSDGTTLTVIVTWPATAAVLTGTVAISGTLKYGETLTATLTGGNNTGILSYQWKRGSTNIGTNSNTYTTVAADIGQTLSCEVTSSVETGTQTGTATGTIGKGTQTVAQGISYGATTFTYGDAQKALTTTPTFSQSGTISYSSSDSSVIFVAADGKLTFNKASSTPVTITATNVATNYENATSTVSITVNRAALTVTAKPHTITYGAAPANDGVAYSGFKNGESASDLTGTLAYDYSYTQYGNVGSYTITPKGYNEVNYDITYDTGTLTIKQKEVGLTWNDTANRKYGDGKTVTATATGIVNSDTITVTVTGGDKTTVGGPYTATTTGLTGSKAGNYKLPSEKTTTYSIGKADALSLSGSATMIKNQSNYKVEVDLTKVSSYPATPGGTPVFSVTSNTTNGLTSAAVDGSTLTLIADNTDNNTADTVTVKVSGMGNYEDSTISINVSYTEKTPVTITGVTAATGLTYSGKPQQGYTGTPTSAYTGEYEISYKSSGDSSYASATAPTNAGSYTVTFKVPESSAAYSGNLVLSFTIQQKAATVKPESKSVKKGETMPSFNLVYEGLISGEALTPSVTPTFSCAATDTSTAGDYTITWSNMRGVSFTGTVADNYSITKVETATLAIAEQMFTLTVSGGGTGATVSDSHASGTTVSINAGTKSGYTFTEWTGSVVFADKNSASTTFTMPEQNVTITANWRYNGGSTGGDGGGSTGGNIITEPNPAEKHTVQNGTLSLDRSELQSLVNAGKSLTISDGKVTLVFDTAAIKAILDTTNGKVTFGINTTNVSDFKNAKAAIGSRPVYSFTISVGGKTVPVNFGTGKVSVSIPYTPAKEEISGNLYAVYVDASGKVEYITGSSYDQNSKAVIFNAPHFSTYGVAYKADAPKFTDITNHWAKADIEFVASRNLLTGTGKTAFSPNTGMTRGMFVTALGRLAGIDVNSYKTSKFTDVKADAYYAPYVNWAKAKGITDGTTATTFSPDKTITRQELAVFMQNYAKAMEYTVPKTREAVTYADNGSIGSWAAEAVKAMQMSGVMNGKDGNKFDPTGTATRAEVSAVLHRYVELVVDPATAQGLDVNDSGSAMMYENGKLVRSTKRTVGGNTYNFNANGEAAMLPQDKRYLTYTVQKGDSFWAISRKYKVSMFELAKLNDKNIFSFIKPGDVLKIPR